MGLFPNSGRCLKVFNTFLALVWAIIHSCCAVEVTLGIVIFGIVPRFLVVEGAEVEVDEVELVVVGWDEVGVSVNNVADDRLAEVELVGAGWDEVGTYGVMDVGNTDINAGGGTP